MKMLEVPEYSLLEIHEFEERTLRLNEKPLLVQLNWHNDDKDGRYPHTRAVQETDVKNFTMP